MAVEKHYVVKEIAELLAMTEEQVLGYIHDGDLPAVNIARQGATRKLWRAPETALAKFLLSRTTQKQENIKRAVEKSIKPKIYV